MLWPGAPQGWGWGCKGILALQSLFFGACPGCCSYSPFLPHKTLLGRDFFCFMDEKTG